MAKGVDAWRFRDAGRAAVTPRAWLRVWTRRYPSGKYDEEHDALMQGGGRRSAADFIRIGKWKDAASTPAKWKPNVASVAYVIWMQAAAERPRCPEESGIAEFLKDWSGRRYTDTFPNKTVQKRFGLSRATTLLYFISGGRFPICDSRVRRAIYRVCGERIPNTAEGYVTSYVPRFLAIAEACRTRDWRALDRALFAYGGKVEP